MRAWIRLLLVILISLLLPLQGSLAYARSVAMAGKSLPIPTAGNALTHHRAGQPTAAGHEAHVTHVTPMAHMAHMAHTPHHPAQPVTHPALSENDFKKPLASPHKHASNACDNCAKCCLAGAAAPPSAGLPSADVPAMRIAFKPAAAVLRGFIAEGLERPPRHLHA